MNGTDALKQNVDNWIKGTNTVKEFKVDWSSITNTSDAQ